MPGLNEISCNIHLKPSLQFKSSTFEIGFNRTQPVASVLLL